MMFFSQSFFNGGFFGGTGAAAGTAAAPTFQFADGDDTVFFSYTVTVPAGGTAIIMHFAVQREPGAAGQAAAASQADALATLSDPLALSGMTAEERSQVVNFNVP